MTRPRPLRGLPLAAAALLCAGCPKAKNTLDAPQEVPAELARAVPKDAFALVYARSIDSLVRLAGIAKDDPDAKLRLDVLATVAGIDLDELDLGRPLAFSSAWREAPQRFAALTILPAPDPAAARATVKGGVIPWRGVAGASHVFLSTLEDPALGSEPAAITKNLPAGDLCVRIDGSRLAAEARKQLESEDLPGRFLASVERIDLSAGLDGPKTRVKAEIALAGAPAPDPKNLERAAARARELAAAIPENHSILAILGMELRPLLALGSEAIGGIMKNAVAPQRAAYATYFPLDPALVPKIGDGGAFSLHGSAAGMEGCFLFESPDAKGFLEQSKALVTDLGFATNGAAVADLSLKDVDGIPTLSYRLVFDPEAFHVEGLKNPEVEQLLKFSVGLLYGERGIRVRTAAVGTTVVHLVNLSETAQLAVLDAVRKKSGALPKLVKRGIEESGIDPQVFLQIDLRGLMRASAEMRQGVQKGALPVALRGEPLPFHLYGRVDGTTWRGGAALDLHDATALYRALNR